VPEITGKYFYSVLGIFTQLYIIKAIKATPLPHFVDSNV
jgi:hypothetical protein